MRKLVAAMLLLLPLLGDIFGPPPRPKASRHSKKRVVLQQKGKIKLLGVVAFSDARYAIVKIGERTFYLREGGRGEYRLVKVLSPRKVIIQIGRKKHVLEIKEEKPWKKLKRSF